MRRARFWTILFAALKFAQAQSYVFFTFDPPGSTATTVAGINNSGQIVGRYTDASGSHGFLRTGANYTNIDVPGANAGSTFAAGINSAGQIVGWYSVGSAPHGFLRSTDGSTFTTIDVPNMPLGLPVNALYGINDKGEIVGIGWSAGPVTDGFLRSADGTITPLQFGSTAAPRGINNSGTIAGYFVRGGSPGLRRGFVRSPDGVYTPIDVPGIEGDQLTGINNQGQVTGEFSGHGFVRNADGTFATFDVPGASATHPTGINDSGQVVGYYSAGAEMHGFLAAPAGGGTQPVIRTVQGVMSAFFYGGFDAIAPGSWIEIYGQNLAPTTREWRASDFTGDQAPVSLDGVRVRINGQPAYVSYISPGQVNAQVPSTVAAGDATVTVTNDQGMSTAYRIAAKASQPGFLAFREYNIAHDQFLGALFPDNMTYVLPPNFDPSLPSRPARAGDTIILYGIGFGPVTPEVAPGRIAPPGLTSLQSSLVIRIGNLPAKVVYAGLAPGYVGLYQFNVEVPAGVPGTLPTVTFELNGVAGTQILETAVAQ